MSRSLGLLLLFAACSGKAGTTTDVDRITEIEDTAAPGLCENIGSYSLDGLTCDQLQGVYFRVLDDASSCDVDTDCVSIDSGCGSVVSGACTVPANTCLDGATFQAVISRWSSCFTTAECPYECGPDTPTCVSGRCELL